jgi:hypothetical protein
MEFLLTLKMARDTVRALIKPGGQLGIGAVRHGSPRVDCSVENASHETNLSGVGAGLSRAGTEAAGRLVDPMPTLGVRAKALSVSLRNGHEVAMFRRRGPTAVLVGACALASSSTLLYPNEARADTVVVQESNGFFGTGSADKATQKVLIGEDKLKVLDAARGWALYVRLDKKSVTEAFAAEKGFVEKPLSSFADIRTQREKTRAEKVDEYKKLVDKAKDDVEKRNLKRKLEEMGLREDGKTVARFESFPDDTKKVTLVVDNVKKEVEVTHHKVRENEGKEIFDVWVAASIPQPAGFFKFYEELGTFSTPVVTELKDKLKGCPIEITAILDNGNEQKTLHSTIREIRTDAAVAAAEYDVPAGWKPMADKPAQGEAPAAKVVCAICGKECSPGAGEASTFSDPWSNKRYPVCSEDHRKDLIRKLAADQRKQQGQPQPKDGPK